MFPVLNVEDTLKSFLRPGNHKYLLFQRRFLKLDFDNQLGLVVTELTIWAQFTNHILQYFTPNFRLNPHEPLYHCLGPASEHLGASPTIKAWRNLGLLLFGKILSIFGQV